MPDVKPISRDAILANAINTIRAKGLAATSVDELCAAAGVTKGAFFHHFKSKEAAAIAPCPTPSTACSAMSTSAKA